jgi:aspartate aminotransferase-like enzyme
MAYKLFIPGPIAVSEKTLRAMAQPMIGHRSTDFVALYQSIQPELQALFGTKDPVYISTSSAWGVMEGAIRNVVKKKVLNCMNGAFSDKWNDVALRCGKQAHALKFEWGQPVDPEAVRAELANGGYDAITLIHNETSTGCMSDLPALMAVIRQFPEVISIVDVVSSFSAMAIPKDELGIDIMITGTQKAMALPPGMALLSVSKRALERAATERARLLLRPPRVPEEPRERDDAEHADHPPHLRPQVEARGHQGRGPRGPLCPPRRLNKMMRDWGIAKGFKLFPAEGRRLDHAELLRQHLNYDLSALNKTLKAKHHLVIDGGYGKLKGKTFRISNMGDETDETIAALIKALDSALAETPKLAA